MILYTREPFSAVFPEEPAAVRLERLPHGYAELSGEQADGAAVCLRRIFSTDPADYLNPDLQPGSRLRPAGKS